MIVILCNSFYDAQSAYHIFLAYLEDCPYRKEDVKRLYPDSYCIETDSDLRYIFVDRRMEKIFKNADIIEVDEFFEDVPEFYDEFGGGWL